jgi:diguanylate cyclase (GGDEF)-like protein
LPDPLRWPSGFPMKPIKTAGVIISVAASWICSTAAIAAAGNPLTSLRNIHTISHEQAAQGEPVLFEASVTYYKKGNIDLFVQDGDVAIYVETTADADLAIGDRVLVHGKTRDSFRPEILSDSVTFLRHGIAPKPVAASFQQLIRAELDCRRVTVRAVVRSADIVSDLGLKNIYLRLLMDGGNIDAEIRKTDSTLVKTLLDSEVEITGAVAGRFDSKTQMTGVLLEVPSLDDLKILKPAEANPAALPITPMDEILKGYDVQDRTQRIRVRGTITYFHPGSTLMLQSGQKSLQIQTLHEEPLQIGDLADVSGFPDVTNGALILTRGEVEDSHVSSPIAPVAVTATELARGAHAFDLISIEGRVSVAIRKAAQDEYVLVSEGHLFSAIYRHPERGLALGLAPMKDVAVGSTVRMTGICIMETGDKYQGPVPFSILLRSSDDVAVVSKQSLLSVRNLTVIVGLLLVVISGTGARSWLIERKVRRQIATQAHIEQRRNRILVDINGSRPIPEIIDHITELISFKLRGAPSWFQTADGSILGNHPSRRHGFRIIERSVLNRSGTALGIIFAALDQRTKPKPIEAEALSMAAELAILAIETRRLYSDLLRRSEFDQLTDIHNRRSLDNRLDEIIAECLLSAATFGLIYIDLNYFKQINDLYGHHIGDVYLQQVALRMTHQLRPADMLARLGGDEFAVLLPSVRTRAEITEIALRLQRSFEDPFAIDGHNLRGSASMGTALYPEDGVTKDSLLNAADSAMYSTKHGRVLDR